MPVTPVLRKLKQEYHEFKASHGSMAKVISGLGVFIVEFLQTFRCLSKFLEKLLGLGCCVALKGHKLQSQVSVI